MSTTEDRSDLDVVETEDTIAIDANKVAQATDAAANQGAVPGTVSPMGNFDGNTPPPR